MKRKRLAEVNPQGRVDALLYRLVERYMGRLESEGGLVGLRENLLPSIEKAIRRNVSAKNVLPEEVRGALTVLHQNLRKS
jgi:hypothetical protein